MTLDNVLHFSPTPPPPPQPQSQIFIPAPELAKSRYNRQLIIPSIALRGQTRISTSKILIIGLGGLGCPAAFYLAGSGVHTLGLVDHDVVEVSNLHRQIGHRESSVFGSTLSTSSTATGVDVGVGVDGDRGTASGSEGLGSSSLPMTKVASALRSCRDLNSEINYRTYEVRLDGGNALDLIREYDIVLDCTDNPATRYLISDVCVVLGKTLVSGAAQRLEGQVMVLNYPIHTATADSTLADVTGTASTAERGPCYRCVFPVPPSPELVQGCSEIGILGPVVGTIGTLMASETLRLIVQPDEVRKPSMLLYNAWSADPRGIFRVIGLRGKRQDCVVCGKDQVLESKNKKRIDEKEIREGRMDYVAFCGKIEDVKVLDEVEERIDASEFLRRAGSDIVDTHDRAATIVDVRERYEVELGPKIQGSINIPISSILRGKPMMGAGKEAQESDDEFEELLQRTTGGSIYFVCQQGNDSQIAAKKLIERQHAAQIKSSKHTTASRWIGDVKGGFVALERAASNG